MLAIRRPVTLALALGALVGAGCGGGSDEQASSGEDGRKAYLADVNEFCAQAEKRSEALPEPQAPDDLLPFTERSIELTEKERDRFEALSPPAGLQGYHDEQLEEADRAIGLFEDLAEDIEGGTEPVKAFREIYPTLVRQVEKSNAKSRELGLDECVTELPAPGAEAPESSS